MSFNANTNSRGKIMNSNKKLQYFKGNLLRNPFNNPTELKQTEDIFNPFPFLRLKGLRKAMGLISNQ